MAATGSSHHHLRENIILLRSLTKQPIEAEQNPTDREYDHEYYLSKKRELQLATHLAFLSATTDNMHKVMAVGLEAGADLLTIRLASNEGDLDVVKIGFDRIAQTLKEAVSRSKFTLAKF